MDVGFTARGAWDGGYYELGIDFRHPSNHLLVEAHRTLWNLPALDGCYASSEAEPRDQTRLPPDDISVLVSGAYGAITLRDGRTLPCRTFFLHDCDGFDALGFGIPQGALDVVYPEVCGFPFASSIEGSRTWREPLDTFLADTARDVYQRAPFLGAAIGHDVTRETDFPDFVPKTSSEYQWASLLVPIDGRLQWFPSTVW